MTMTLPPMYLTPLKNPTRPIKKLGISIATFRRKISLFRPSLELLITLHTVSLYLNLAPTIYYGLKRFAFKARFMILILTM
jgi:hypothetical protein